MIGASWHNCRYYSQKQAELLSRIPALREQLESIDSREVGILVMLALKAEDPKGWKFIPE